MDYVTVFEKKKKLIETKRESALRLVDDSYNDKYICTLLIDGCRTTRINLKDKAQLEQFKKDYL